MNTQAREQLVHDAEAPHGDDVVLAGEERGVGEGVADDKVRVCDALVRLHEGVAQDQVRVYHAVRLPEEVEPAEAVGDLLPCPGSGGEEVER
jgi:hypothetical protein